MAVIKMEGYHFYLLVCLITPAVSFQFTKRPNNPLVVVYYKNRTNVELRWEWTLASGEVLSPIKIKRYRKNHANNTETTLATYSASPSTDTTKYSFNVVNNINGYASFVIKDITNQGNINVMAENEVYIYKIVVDELTRPVEYTDEVELNTFKTPSITTYPKNQTATGGTVTFTCAADGKPAPTITWEKIGSSQSFSQGSPLTITKFDASKVGVYRCTAKCVGIAENATGTGTVQLTTCGSGCDMEVLGIEFPDLTYNYEYENPSYNKYKELKSKIETGCLMAYAKLKKTILKCEVKGFRRGSVVAVVELAWPTNIVDPKQPLLQAINGGNFAGYKVNTAFVSPTPLIPTDVPTTSTPEGRSGFDKEVVGIEFPDLTYNYEYDTPSSNKYKKLKNKIETECLMAYAKSKKTINKCEVKGFRRGSVVAVVELAWPTNIVDPKQPLLQAINDGHFAGYKVNTAFVNPTSTSPTQAPTTSTPKVSVAISVCVTIIVILALSNAVLGFLLWKKNKKNSKEILNYDNLAQTASNEYQLSAYNDTGYTAEMGNKQPGIPTAPPHYEEVTKG